MRAGACARQSVTWSRLSKLSDNREDCHQPPQSDCVTASYDALLEQNRLCVIEPNSVSEIEYVMARR